LTLVIKRVNGEIIGNSARQSPHRRSYPDGAVLEVYAKPGFSHASPQVKDLRKGNFA
jgi:hypothetical protein